MQRPLGWSAVQGARRWVIVPVELRHEVRSAANPVQDTRKSFRALLELVVIAMSQPIPVGCRNSATQHLEQELDGEVGWIPRSLEKGIDLIREVYIESSSLRHYVFRHPNDMRFFLLGYIG